MRVRRGGVERARHVGNEAYLETIVELKHSSRVTTWSQNDLGRPGRLTQPRPPFATCRSLSGHTVFTVGSRECAAEPCAGECERPPTAVQFAAGMFKRQARLPIGRHAPPERDVPSLSELANPLRT